MPRRQGAEGATVVSRQPGGAERLGDGGVSVAHQQRALQRQRHPLDHAARPVLEVVGIGAARRAARPRTRRGARRRRRRASISPKNASSASGLAAQRAQHVEADDVARAFPDARSAATRGRAAAGSTPRRSRSPPRHSSASATSGGLALAHPVLRHRGGEARELPLLRRRARPRRRRAPAASSRSSRPRTRRTGRRGRSASAADRSSRLPNALRCAQWCVACATAWRMPEAEPMTQSSRVWFTISMMVATPRPSSPTMRAQAPSNSTSLDAFERLPSLSLRRWRWKRLRVPSGRQRGNRKQESPRSVCASMRKHVAHRRRAEPLVAGDLVLGAGAAAAECASARWCWRGRRSRPASRSSPCRRARRSSPPPAACAGRSGSR